MDKDKEIEMLKAEINKLRQENMKSKNWDNLRRYYIEPKLKETWDYAPADCYRRLVGPISIIVRELMGVYKLKDINFENFELAKEISMDIIKTLAAYQWQTAQQVVAIRAKYEEKQQCSQ